MLKLLFTRLYICVWIIVTPCFMACPTKFSIVCSYSKIQPLRSLHIPKKSAHMIYSNYWLPVISCIQFKIHVLAFKARHGSADSSLSELIHLYAPARTLTSSSENLLAVPKIRLSKCWWSGFQHFGF